MSRVLSLVRFFESRFERRGRRRLRADIEIVISGSLGQTTARTVDMSRRGMGMVVDQPLEPGTMFHLRVPTLVLTGFATVRACERRQDGRYRMGVEFCEPLSRDPGNGFRRPDAGCWHVHRVSPPSTAWSAVDDDSR